MAVKIPMTTLEKIIKVARRSREFVRVVLSGGRVVTAQPAGDQVVWRVKDDDGEAIRGVRQPDGTDVIR